MNYKINEIDIVYTKENYSSFQKAGCIIMLLSLYSMGTISSITESWLITFSITALSIVITFLAKLSNRIKVNGILLWLIPLIICLIGSVRTGYYQDIVFYILITAILFQISTYTNDTIISMFRCFIIFSIFFAFGEFWQYFNESAYYKYLYPLFTTFYQQSIRRQFYFHKMCTGFTSQTVVSAEFILLGLVTIYYLLPTLRRWKILLYCTIGFLMGGLLLTGKRSSLLFLIMALVYTEIKTTSLNKRAIRTIKITFLILFLLLISYNFILPRFVDSRNSLARIFEYMGGNSDISNGRWELFSYAIAGFKESPIIGKGWGWYKQNFDTTGAHNIYLQLFCECGVLGALPVIFTLAFWYIRTRAKINRVLKNNRNAIVSPYLKFSHFTQVFILVYGMVGNPIYDYNFLLWFIFSIGLMYNRSFASSQ